MNLGTAALDLLFPPKCPFCRHLLEDPRANIKDVSRSVGYSDSKYFSKIFKRITGQLPSEYRDGLPPAK